MTVGTGVRTVPVEIQDDFVEHQARAAPLQALAEFVWNALDADATEVDIALDRSELGLTHITIRDNGTGIPYDDAPKLFSHLGGSWKKMRGTTLRDGRALHGREGRGRFKAIALGGAADWHVTYEHPNAKELRSFSLALLASHPKQIRLTEEKPAISPRSGVEVVITEPKQDFRSLQSEDTAQDLAEIFAPYLKNYRAVTISYQGVKLDPGSVTTGTKAYNLNDIDVEGKTYSIRLEIVEWRRMNKRALYLCNGKGFPLATADARFHVGGYFFSAYLISSYIETLHDNNMLQLGEMTPGLSGAIDQARDQIKDHFRRRSAEAARGVVETWKAERSYPYVNAPRTALEEIERQRFDIVAVTASEHVPEFLTATPKARAWHLRLLRQAIERSPDDLQLIFSEVLKLPQRKQEEMASLLREAELTSIIGAAHVVADRLKFLAGIEAILFAPDLKPHLKERSQLHRIVAENTWLFGEEFNLMVDDRSLTECLRQHAKSLKKKLVIDAPVKHPTKARGIVDLMLSKQRRLHRVSDVEHLVVELKAPTVPIGRKEVVQIEEYAQAIVSDARFDVTNTKWKFWALSNEVDEAALGMRQIPNAPEGTIVDNNGVTIVVRRWGQIINENKARLQFFQERLNHSVDKASALKHLRERYDTILTTTVTEDAIEAAELAEATAGDLSEDAHV
ncbi:ATP-binding protein [Methylobacterium sp. NEAU 140]|uniref:ATP-binding protein n=1 Tax=Methylobacterium sp. NEAU 140 TaxID=3064945 RepID=UPI002736569E|nr:ATP-binding protein [Methylobacterium sp. NEAU 140]MDP4025732.1 ATP-binding protein [Methylobacterium sp. NEAU 140]